MMISRINLVYCFVFCLMLISTGMSRRAFADFPTPPTPPTPPTAPTQPGGPGGPGEVKDSQDAESEEASSKNLSGKIPGGELSGGELPGVRLRMQRDDGKRGLLMTTFADRSPWGRFPELLARTRLRTQGKPTFYKIADESFVLYVPESYEPTEAMGLVVWMGESPAAVPPAAWCEVLDKHGLIWVGANNTGKTQPRHRRLSLALDAAFNAQKKYNIDPNRLYLAGLSTGGEAASILAAHYPDVFRGSLLMQGSLYHRDLHLIDQPQKTLPAGFRRPMMTRYFQVKMHSRHVLIAGEQAANFSDLKTIYQNGWIEDRYRSTTFLVMPGIASEQPNAHWFEQAIKAVEPSKATTTQAAWAR